MQIELNYGVDSRLGLDAVTIRPAVRLLLVMVAVRPPLAVMIVRIAATAIDVRPLLTAMIKIAVRPLLAAVIMIDAMTDLNVAIDTAPIAVIAITVAGTIFIAAIAMILAGTILIRMLLRMVAPLVAGPLIMGENADGRMPAEKLMPGPAEGRKPTLDNKLKTEPTSTNNSIKSSNNSHSSSSIHLRIHLRCNH